MLKRNTLSQLIPPVSKRSSFHGILYFRVPIFRYFLVFSLLTFTSPDLNTAMEVCLSISSVFEGHTS